MGIHPTAITKWENGKSQPTHVTRERALAAIGWTPPQPSEAPINEVPRVRQRDDLPEATDWEPPRYTPPHRRHRGLASIYLSLSTDQRPEEEDPDSPYFVSK